MDNITLESRIGFVGLGNMGSPMSARLAAAGYRVRGTDPLEEPRKRLIASGGEAVKAASDLGSADVLILMLPSSEVVEQVLLADGLAEGLQPGAMVIDMSSSEPLRTRDLAASLRSRGLRFVDAPVSGGVRGAEAGSLAIMVGGNDVDVAEATPLLEVLGRPRHVGDVGSGHALKALNNLLSATHLWITSEAMAAGQRFGLDPAVMLEAINESSGRSGSTETKWPLFVLPGTFDSGFPLRLMLKDMRIAIGLAHSVGASSELGDAAVRSWSRAAADLATNADHTEVARWIDAAAFAASQ